MWTKEELHIEHITLDETLTKSALPIAQTIYKLCVLPELLGKLHTTQGFICATSQKQSLQTEKDDGTWCYCKEREGGNMVGSTWSVLNCLLCPMANSSVQHAVLTCTKIRQEEKRALYNYTLLFLQYCCNNYGCLHIHYMRILVCTHMYGNVHNRYLTCKVKE